MQPSQSLVSRARTAIHSAAARVLTDIKADLRGTCAVGAGSSRSLFAPASESDELPGGGGVGSVVVGAQMPKDPAGVAERRRRGRPWIGRPPKRAPRGGSRT